MALIGKIEDNIEKKGKLLSFLNNVLHTYPNQRNISYFGLISKEFTYVIADDIVIKVIVRLDHSYRIKYFDCNKEKDLDFILKILPLHLRKKILFNIDLFT